MSEIKVNEDTRDGHPIVMFSKIIKGEEVAVVFQQDTATIGELLDKAMLHFKRREFPLDRAKMEAEASALFLGFRSPQ